MTFTKGDIVWVDEERRNPSMLLHPAIVWDDSVSEDADFHGIMLTHSKPNGRYDNIPMTEDHFELGHQVGFTNTHFVNQLFKKFRGWGPFIKMGALTPDGIEFIKSKLSNTYAKNYDKYVENIIK